MYRHLNADHIIQTISLLRTRIEERFPSSGLSKVVGELQRIGDESVERSAWMQKPNLALRLGIWSMVALLLAVVVTGLVSLQVSTKVQTFVELVQMIESGINDLVFIGLAIFFLSSLEVRVKRKRALAAIHELRSLAHIIDMHQLTKDPERILVHGPDTKSSPKRTMTNFELVRYLDYSSEMLSLIGKLAALYGERFDDPVALAAVDEIESLTTGLSRKIWQKIMIVHQHAARSQPAASEP